MSSRATIKVGVVEEHEIFRRGLVVSLSEDPLISVVVATSSDFMEDVDIAVASPKAASGERFQCPLVVCSGDARVPNHGGEINDVVAMLPRSTLTAEQLLAAVHAAAAGLRVSVRGPDPRPSVATSLDSRSQDVLRLLAKGAATREIAERLSYSERTIKSVIREIERALGASTRAQAVAYGIRHRLI